MQKKSCELFRKIIIPSWQQNFCNLSARAFGVLVLLLALAFAGAQLQLARQYVANDHLIDDDLRQHLTPFVAARQPSAFHDRFVLDYATAYLPPGYYHLMRQIVRFTDPLRASKYLGVALMLATVALALWAGGKAGGLLGAAVALALTMRADIFTSNVFAGLFRSFAVPFGFLHIVLLYGRHYHLAAANLVLQALFYPPLCLLNLPTTLALFAIYGKRSLAKVLIFCLLLGLAFLSLFLFKLQTRDYGAPISLTEAQLMCEWHEAGRLEELPFEGFAPSLHDGFVRRSAPYAGGKMFLPAAFPPGPWQVYMIPAILLVLFLFLVWQRRPSALILLLMTLSAVLFFWLSRRQAFRIGYPDRYLWHALPFVAIMLWPSAWGALRFKWPGRAAPQLALILLGAGIWFAYPWRLPRMDEIVIETSARQGLHAAIRQAPSTALFAAWSPNVLDEIPLYSSREVLVNIENAHPIYMPYYREVRARMLGMMDLAFATNVAEAVAIRDRWGITHLVLERVLELPSVRMPGVFEPFYRLGGHVRRNIPTERMIFARPAPDWVFYNDAEFVVMDLGRLSPVSEARISEQMDSVACCVFTNNIELLEMRILPETIKQDGTFVAEYSWRMPAYLVHSPIAVFVHFVQDDELVFTGDHPLFSAVDFSAVNWRVSEPLVINYRHIHRAPRLKGEYDILLGLVNMRTRRRIPPLTPDHINGALRLPAGFHALPADMAEGPADSEG